MTSENSSKVANILLNCNAVLLQPNDPFTFASGIKSPVYADCRRLMSFPSEREEICTYFTALVEQLGEVDIIAATASAGIPHGAWLAQKLSNPLI